MKKNLFIAASILLLAASCGKTASPQPTAQPDNAKNEASANTKGQGSFKDLIAMGKPLKCESSFTSEGNTSTGTMYVAGGKMRGDFNSQAQGKTMQTHMIVKDQTAYTWVEGLGASMAFKSSITQNNPTQNGTAPKSANVDQQVSYNCQSWGEDDSQFALPSGITFQDQSQMMQNLAPKIPAPDAQPGSNPAACAACNSAPASSKAQCLAALGCK
jgi:hypothetical protein